MMEMHESHTREIAVSGGSPSGTSAGIVVSSFRHPIIRLSSGRFPLKQKGTGSETADHAKVNLAVKDQPCVQYSGRDILASRRQPSLKVKNCTSDRRQLRRRKLRWLEISDQQRRTRRRLDRAHRKRCSWMQIDLRE